MENEKNCYSQFLCALESVLKTEGIIHNTKFSLVLFLIINSKAKRSLFDFVSF